MKGTTPNKEEKALWDRLASVVGCICCRIEGRFNDQVSIHHIDGRTKKDAHKKVLPLCAGHHQDNGTAIAVHPYKARFQAKYGNQYDLLAQCLQMIGVK